MSSPVTPEDLARFEADSDLAHALLRAIRETPNTTGFVLRGGQWGVTVGYEWSEPNPANLRGASRIGPKDNATLATLHAVLGAALRAPVR